MADNSTTVNVPEYQKPDVPTFSLPGYGSTTYADNNYGISFDPSQQSYQNQIQALRSSILSGLGITSPQRQASLNQWEDTFNKEALRTSMPNLEQTLFARGLGGSKFYQDSVTDLLSKVATQGVLNREQLSQQDESQKLAQLAAISGLNQQDFQNMLASIGLSTNQYNADQASAMNLYTATLPYLTTVEQSNNGVGGALSGALQGAAKGFAVGGPIGAIGGGVAGGATGYYGSRGTSSTPYINYAAGLKNTQSGGKNSLGSGGTDWLQYLQYMN